jgi:putative tryptophan/tyrosine transport system substrate-binding protein
LRRLLILQLAALAWIWSGATYAQESHLWVVLSESGGPYAETAAALRSELSALPRGVELRIGSWQDLNGAGARPPQLMVTLGAMALRNAIDNVQREPGLARVPILAALLPRASYDALVPKSRANTSAVFLDQPLGRYLDLLRLAMPERKKIGVLLGPESAALVPALLKAATARGLRLVTAEVSGDSDEIYPALRTVLGEADVLLALPDNQIFNASSLQNILISTYRQRIPMVAFSAGYAKAGAVLALYTAPTQVATQIAAIVKSFVAGRGLPPPQLAAEFSVVANQRVARSLGVLTDDAVALTEALKHQEAGR